MAIKRFRITLNGVAHDVEVEELIGTENSASPKTVAPAAAPAPAVAPVVKAAVPAAGEEIITAPMPGKILKVCVAEGQAVKSGDNLFILEAMKMENEIVCPRDGVMGAISVTADASVSTGDVLGILK